MYKTNRCVDDTPTAKQFDGMPAGTDMSMGECGCPPIYECPCERVCHREINHVVPHVQPVNTKIINHHIYHHTYTPCYTCCEENEVCNVYDNNPCCK